MDGLGISKPFSPSSSAAFVSIFANRCPFLLRGFPALLFFESVRCSSKSDSNGIDHVEHWIYGWRHPSNLGFSNFIHKSPHPMTPNPFAKKKVNHKCNTLCVSRWIVLEGHLDVRSALSSSMEKNVQPLGDQ